MPTSPVTAPGRTVSLPPTFGPQGAIAELLSGDTFGGRPRLLGEIFNILSLFPRDGLGGRPRLGGMGLSDSGLTRKPPLHSYI